MKKQIILFLTVLFYGLSFAQTQDGDLDLNFNAGTGTDADIFKVLTQPDGKVLIGGMFYEYNGVERTGLARINPDGSLDQDFNPSIEDDGYNGIVRNIALQEDGKIIIVGEFTHCNGEDRNAIARLNNDGTLDETFNPVFKATDIFGDVNFAYYIIGIEVVEEDKILVYGEFDQCNDVERKGVARLNSDGTLDETFHFVQGLLDLGDRKTNNFAVQTDGKILIGGKGGMTIYAGDTIKGIIRLHPDGAFDSQFIQNITTSPEENIRVYSLATLPNNDVLVSGIYESGGFSSGGFFFYKLNDEDGKINTTFSTLINDSEEYDVAYSIKVTEDDKIILSSDGFIIRLLSNGELDPTFNSENQIDGRVYDFDFLLEEGMIIGGAFWEINSNPINSIARLYYQIGSSSLTFNELKELSIYPNPANDKITILDVPLNSEVVITDLAGQKMKEILANSSIMQIDVSNLKSGIYLVNVIQGNDKFVSKLIVNK